MSAKFVRIVLVMAMLFSSIGVSAASTLCRQKQKMSAPACQKCKSGSPTQKSCCKKVYSHLGVKSEYQRPATSSVDQASAMLVAVLADRPITIERMALVTPIGNTGPPIALGSLDRCSLISSFRI